MYYRFKTKLNICIYASFFSRFFFHKVLSFYYFFIIISVYFNRILLKCVCMHIFIKSHTHKNVQLWIKCHGPWILKKSYYYVLFMLIDDEDKLSNFIFTPIVEGKHVNFYQLSSCMSVKQSGWFVTHIILYGRRYHC